MESSADDRKEVVVAQQPVSALNEDDSGRVLDRQEDSRAGAPADDIAAVAASDSTPTVANAVRLEFWDEASFFERFSVSFSRFINFASGRPDLRLIKYKDSKGSVSLTDLGRVVGLNTSGVEEILSYHKKRLKYQQWLSAIFAMLLSILFVMAPAFYLYNQISLETIFFLGVEYPIRIMIIAIFAPILFQAAMLFVQGLIIRLVDFIVNRYYADTMSIKTLMELLFELQSLKGLAYSNKRRQLQARISYLAELTLLLAARYSSKSQFVQGSTTRHFKMMELFIRERERMLIAPTDTTRADLLKDFYELAPVYLYGYYGKFTLPDPATTPEEQQGRWHSSRFFSGLLRFVGFILPLLLMGYYLRNPQAFPFVKIDASIVTIIFGAWLLIAIDNIMKLGVMTQLLSVAKGIKDLK